MSRKKKIPIIFLVLFLLAGVITTAQESPTRWFRSNAGGMALEETQSRLVAMRNEYALGIRSASFGELPEYLLPYYNTGYLIENRIFYKNRELIRTQWLFKNIRGGTRLNAVIFEPENIEDSEEEKYITGFIEIFDERSFLTSEYRFYEDGGITRIDYVSNNNLITNATVFILEDTEENEGNKDFIKSYADYYRYNRSSSLRSVERIFYRDMLIPSNSPALITFPRHVMDAVGEEFITGGRINLIPDFFGDTFVQVDSRIIHDTDERGRVLSQTFYDDEGEILWTISNTWLNNRIVSTAKIEGSIISLAEYEYDSAGDRIMERNYTNGVLERVVRAEGGFDIEELYLNNVVVLRAVWEGGRKISETRVRN